MNDTSGQLRYIHGPFLDQVCDEIGVNPTPNNKDVIKAMLKKAHGIKSLGHLDVAGLAYFIERSAILLAGEFAIAIRFPGEEKEEDDIRSFYKALYQKESNHDSTTGEASKDR